MAGLINVGRQTLGQATQGFGAASQLEQSRNAMGRQLDAARNAQRMSMATTGAGLGASIGVNNLMAAQKAALAGQPIAGASNIGTGAVFNAAPTLGGQAITQGAGTIAPEALAAFEASTIAAPTGGVTVAGGGSTLGLSGAAAGEAALAATAPEIAAATTATTTAGSTGTMAAIGAVATPLLIGAGAALLLDSLFDIF